MTDTVVLQGWYHWDEAIACPENKMPGVAHFSTPPESVDPTDSKIIYIGETCGQTLRQRWKQFGYSAFQNKFAHSGGATYFNEFQGGKRDELFVAFAIPKDEGIALTYHIRYLERKWLHEFVQKHGEPPRCNHK